MGPARQRACRAWGLAGLGSGPPRAQGFHEVPFGLRLGFRGPRRFFRRAAGVPRAAALSGDPRSY
eukprot:2614174-Pyramimonas_sp.AAC.1